jgi:ATP-dependent Clp protease protease subunit
MAKLNKDHIDYFFEYGLELATRTIYIGYGDDEDSDLDQKVAANVIKSLCILSNASPDLPINIIINNQGGFAIHGLAIYDAIRQVPNHVVITVYGHCYSIGAWILQAGDTRRISPHSSLMIHHGSGDKNEFDRELDQICLQLLLKRIREKNPSFTEKQLDKLLLKDSFMWPTKALELGLVDEVLEDK